MKRLTNYNKLYLNIIKGFLLIFILFLLFVLVKNSYAVEFDESLSFDENNKIIGNINAGMTKNDIISKVNTDGTISILDNSNNSLSDNDRLKTGYKLKIELSGETIIYKVSVNGDVDGNGVVNDDDAIKLSKHYIKGNILVEEEYKTAGDMNKNNKIDINDIILVLKYEEPEDVVEKYTVKFELNGGTGTINNQTVEVGQLAKKPSNPTRSGFKFMGWYTSDKQTYDFTQKVNSNITLYALWSPIIRYDALNSGKWIFVNNPEGLDKTSYLADSDCGGVSLYKDYFNGDAEIYYEHGIDKNVVSYYAIRFYNPNTTNVTLTINKCGAETGWDSEGIIDYYFNNKCSARGSYTIGPSQTLYIYHSDNSQIVGDSSAIVNVSKINGTAIEGMISLHSSNKLHMSSIAFKDVNKTSNAVYNGNWADISASGQNHALVYSGYYDKLPILTNNITIPIYDQTPTGDLPVSYTNNGGEEVTETSWTTNLPGGYVWQNAVFHQKDVFVQDFVNLIVPTQFDSYTNTVNSSIILGPYDKYKEERDIKNYDGSSIKGWNYNWANWAVHYREMVTIVNNSSTSKTVSFNLKYDTADNRNRIAVYYNNVVNAVGKAQNYQVWSVTIPAGSSKTVEAEITLMGHSNGRIDKSFKLS